MEQSSILIPVYNQDPAYLRAALVSAMLQEEPCEVIVVDDGSDAPCKSVVDEVRGIRPEANVVYHYQENRGVAGALNTALGLSQCEYIQWLPSDDVFRYSKTGMQIAAMISERAMVSYTAWEEGVPQAGATYPAPNYPSQEAFFGALREHCFVNAATVMWHRSVFDDLGGFNEGIIHMQDFEMLLRCAEVHNFLGINSPLVRRRIHEGQMLNTLRREGEAVKKRDDAEYIRQRYGAVGHVWLPTEEKG